MPMTPIEREEQRRKEQHQGRFLEYIAEYEKQQSSKQQKQEVEAEQKLFSQRIAPVMRYLTYPYIATSMVLRAGAPHHVAEQAKHEPTIFEKGYHFLESTKVGNMPLIIPAAGFYGLMSGTSGASSLRSTLTSKAYEKELGAAGYASRALGALYGINRLMYTTPLALGTVIPPLLGGHPISHMPFTSPLYSVEKGMYHGINAALGSTLGVHLPTAGALGSLSMFAPFLAMSMGVSMWKASRMAKLKAAPVQEGEIERRYSVSDSINPYVQQLTAQGQLRPGEQVQIALLTAIEKHTSPIAGIYSLLDLQEQKKSKPKESGIEDYSKYVHEQVDESLKSEFGAVFSNLEKQLLKLQVKLDPFQQFWNLLTGKTPLQTLRMIERVYGKTQTPLAEKKQVSFLGVRMSDARLLTTRSYELMSMADSYEGKMLLLTAGIYDIMNFQARELLTIRRFGLGRTEAVGYTPPETTWKQLMDIIKELPEKIAYSIPGIAALVSWAKLLPQFTHFIVDLPNKAKNLYQQLQDRFLTKPKELAVTEAKRALESKIKSVEQRAYGYIADGLPNLLYKLYSVNVEQLDVLSRLLQLFERLSNIQTKQMHQVPQLQWNPFTNKYESITEETVQSLKNELLQTAIEAYTPVLNKALFKSNITQKVRKEIEEYIEQSISKQFTKSIPGYNFREESSPIVTPPPPPQMQLRGLTTPTVPEHKGIVLANKGGVLVTRTRTISQELSEVRQEEEQREESKFRETLSKAAVTIVNELKKLYKATKPSKQFTKQLSLGIVDALKFVGEHPLLTLGLGLGTMLAPSSFRLIKEGAAFAKYLSVRTVDGIVKDFEKIQSVAGKIISKIGDFISWLGKRVDSFGEIAIKGEEIAGKLLKLFEPVNKFFNLIGSYLGKMGKAAAEFGKGTSWLSKFVPTIGKYAEEAAKASGKGIIKIFGKVGKKLGPLAPIIGGYLAFQRFKDKDYLGAALELISGVTAAVPGVGTVASFLIDGLLWLKDHIFGHKEEKASSSHVAGISVGKTFATPINKLEKDKAAYNNLSKEQKRVVDLVTSHEKVYPKSLKDVINRFDLVSMPEEAVQDILSRADALSKKKNISEDEYIAFGEYLMKHYNQYLITKPASSISESPSSVILPKTGPSATFSEAGSLGMIGIEAPSKSHTTHPITGGTGGFVEAGIVPTIRRQSTSPDVQRVVSRWKDLAVEVSSELEEKGLHVSPSLILAEIYQESRGKPDAVSHVGARGLMQIMPSTAAYLSKLTGLSKEEILSDPYANVYAGSYYLATLLKRYKGDLVKALAAYNWGPGNVGKYYSGKIDKMPKETQNYIANVPRIMQQLSYVDTEVFESAPKTAMATPAGNNWTGIATTATEATKTVSEASLNLKQQQLVQPQQSPVIINNNQPVPSIPEKPEEPTIDPVAENIADKLFANQVNAFATQMQQYPIIPVGVG